MNINKIKCDLYQRLVNQEFKGLDPSAVSFDKRILKIDRILDSVKLKILVKILKSLYYRFIFYSGHFFTKILNIQPIVYTKGIALVLSSLAIDGKKSDDAIVKKIEKLLLDKKLNGKFLWSHDIEYFFPEGTKVTVETPNLITTGFVANSFWDMYQYSKDLKWLSYFNNTVKDMIDSFPYDELEDDTICFMYTPITLYHVHNANLLMIELLSKYLYVNPQLVEKYKLLIIKGIKYSLNHFLETKSMPYAGKPTENLSVDNYHTGYVIRSLNEIAKYASNIIDKEIITTHIKDFIEFYFKTFFDEKYVYKTKYKNLIESHSLAEGIIMYNTFKGHLNPELVRKYSNAISNTFNILYNSDERFFYNNAKLFYFFRLVDKTEYTRWSNSWMLYALTIWIKNGNN